MSHHKREPPSRRRPLMPHKGCSAPRVWFPQTALFSQASHTPRRWTPAKTALPFYIPENVCPGGQPSSAPLQRRARPVCQAHLSIKISPDQECCGLHGFPPQNWLQHQTHIPKTACPADCGLGYLPWQKYSANPLKHKLSFPDFRRRSARQGLPIVHSSSSAKHNE